MATPILIVEDEPLLGRNLKRYLDRLGHEVQLVGDGAAALDRLERFRPELVLLDFQLPGADGLTVLRQLRLRDAAPSVIMMTAHGGTRLAVEAIKAGACDYLPKPLALGELEQLILRVLGERQGGERQGGERAGGQAAAPAGGGMAAIVGQSPAMAALRQRIGQLLAAEARLAAGAAPPVLITGETGTGKQLIARALHLDGRRAGGPFIELNCAALPAHLVESELFGHERGAFTDARERKPGLAEAADGGTLFLDEIGELELAAQGKLLKLLEDGTVRRVGSVRDQRIDIRVVAATNRDLEAQVRDGRFRADLYYRLRVVQLAAPPLRERGDDLLLLAERFVAEQARRYGRAGLALGPAAREALMRHCWPGNVRELRNRIEEAVLLSPGPIIGPELLPRPGDVAATEPLPGAATLEAAERGLIARALAATGGNVTHAARSLGVSRDTLRYRLRKHGRAEGPPDAG